MSELNDKVCRDLGVKAFGDTCGAPEDECPPEFEGENYTEESCDHCPKLVPHYPDLTAQVTVMCGECGGSGYIEGKPYKWGSDNEAPCPTCNGYPERKIPFLQQILEERGEWEAFVDRLSNKYEPKIGIDWWAMLFIVTNKLTDANALLRAYAEVKEGEG